ncbi:hypothetical protein Tco_0762181 [Tanacetum coccineum]
MISILVTPRVSALAGCDKQEPFHAVKVSIIPEPTQIPPPTPPLPTTVIPYALVPNSKAFTIVLQRDDVSKFIKVKQELAAKEKMLKYSTTPYDQVVEDEHKQKEILFQIMMASKSHEKHPAYKALKRRHDDKDQDSPAGSDQGMKKRRTRKVVEPSKKSSKSKESAKGITPSNTSKTGKSISADISVHEPKHIVQMDVEEPNLDNVAKDADKPQADDIPKNLKKDWFKKSSRPETLNPEWNIVKTVDDAPKQSRFNKMIQAEKPPLTFDELMSTPIDFFCICHESSQIKQDHKSRSSGPSVQPRNKERPYSSFITKTPAARYTMEGIEDMIPTLWSPVKISYDKDAALGISHWGPQRQLFYRAMINKDLHLNDIEDMLLLIAENKLFNIEGDVIFCDGTLQSIHNILRERLLNFKFGYNKDMPLRVWPTKDKRRTGIMLNMIDDQLFKIRVLRSLEVLAGGRKIETDKRLLQMTNWRDLPMDIPLDRIEVLRLVEVTTDGVNNRYTKSETEVEFRSFLETLSMHYIGKNERYRMTKDSFILHGSRLQDLANKGLRPNGDTLRKCILEGPYTPSTVIIPVVPATNNSPAIPERTTVETVLNMSPKNKAQFESEKEVIHLILTRIGDEIYSTVDACKTTHEMWEAIERLQQGESLNIQDVKTNLFWEFRKFTSHDGESIESYYTRFFKLVNEMIRNNLTVATMQVNVQFLQQLQPEWTRFVTIVKQQQKLDEVSYHKLFDILKQYQKEVNELRAKIIAKNANPLALVATSQPYQDPYYQAPKSHKSYAPTSKASLPTKSHATTRHKGKEIAKPITPLSESASKEDSDPEQA